MDIFKEQKRNIWLNRIKIAVILVAVLLIIDPIRRWWINYTWDEPFVFDNFTGEILSSSPPIPPNELEILIPVIFGLFIVVGIGSFIKNRYRLFGIMLIPVGFLLTIILGEILAFRMGIIDVCAGFCSRSAMITESIIILAFYLPIILSIGAAIYLVFFRERRRNKIIQQEKLFEEMTEHDLIKLIE